MSSLVFGGGVSCLAHGAKVMCSFSFEYHSLRPLGVQKTTVAERKTNHRKGNKSLLVLRGQIIDDGN